MRSFAEPSSEVDCHGRALRCTTEGHSWEKQYLVHLLGCCHGIPGDASKVLIHSLLGRRQVAHLGAQALRDGQVEAACLLHLHIVQEGPPSLFCLHSALHHQIRSANAVTPAVVPDARLTAAQTHWPCMLFQQWRVVQSKSFFLGHPSGTLEIASSLGKLAGSMASHDGGPMLGTSL